MSKKLLGAATGLTAAGLAAYSLKIEPLLVEVTHQTLVLPSLPAAWDGLSILFLSDPHVWEFGKRERRVVEEAVEHEAPDRRQRRRRGLGNERRGRKTSDGGDREDRDRGL